MEDSQGWAGGRRDHFRRKRRQPYQVFREARCHEKGDTEPLDLTRESVVISEGALTDIERLR